jgi:hypothetical protein
LGPRFGPLWVRATISIAPRASLQPLRAYATACLSYTSTNRR